MIREPEDKAVYLFGHEFVTTSSGLKEFGLINGQQVDIDTATKVDEWNMAGDEAHKSIKRVMYGISV